MRPGIRTGLDYPCVDWGSNPKTGFEVELVKCADVKSAHRLGRSLYLAFTP